MIKIYLLIIAYLLQCLNKDKQMIWSMNFKQDNKKEAILFYKLPNEDHSVYLAVYEEIGNGWRIKSTHKFDGGDVDIVEVGDFTGNGKRELLIGISVNRESLEHVMYVFFGRK